VGEGLRRAECGMSAIPTVFMFSGQGSQYFQMGRELFEKNALFRSWMVRLDDLAQQLSGASVVDALYSNERGKAEPFDRTLLTHPAIFMVEYCLAQVLIHHGLRPDFVLGASLGAFAAAAVAGFLEVEMALEGVIRQAIALEERSERGGMIAILHDPALYSEEFLREQSELAGVNFCTHFVVSARSRELEEIEAVLRRRSIDYQRLPVSLPFHSRWIDNAKVPFESFMRSIGCRPGRVPLVCCEQTAALTDLADGYFWTVVRRPIRFREAAAGLEQWGACRYIDVGPAGTLATFLKYTMSPSSRSVICAILTPYGLDQRNLAATLAAVNN